MDPLVTSTRMEDRWEVLEEDLAFQMSILIAEELLPFKNPMDRVPNSNTEEWEVVSVALILTTYSLIHQVIKRTLRVFKEASAPQEVACKVEANQEVLTS